MNWYLVVVTAPAVLVAVLFLAMVAWAIASGRKRGMRRRLEERRELSMALTKVDRARGLSLDNTVHLSDHTVHLNAPTELHLAFPPLGPRVRPERHRRPRNSHGV